jgi:hypothetical protein
MLRPLMAARVEKADNSSCARIASGNVRAFVIVTEKTGEGQVSGNRQAAVLARNNVINLKGKVIIRLQHPAIFTEMPSAPPDKTFEAKFHSSI